MLPTKNVMPAVGKPLVGSHGKSAHKLKGAPANAGLVRVAVRVTLLPCRTAPDTGCKVALVEACVMVNFAAAELLALKLLSARYCATRECWPALNPKYPFGVMVLPSLFRFKTPTELPLSINSTLPVGMPWLDLDEASARMRTRLPKGPPVNGTRFPPSTVNRLSVVLLSSGEIVTLMGLDAGLAPKTASPPYWAVRVYVPPGKSLTAAEAEPLLRVRNPACAGGKASMKPGALIRLV